MKINFVIGIIADAVIEPDGDFTRKDLPPGSAEWSALESGEIASLIIVCPCGCGKVAPITIASPARNGWTWDGNKEAPTLTPSIYFRVGCGWHGYLTKGELVSC